MTNQRVLNPSHISTSSVADGRASSRKRDVSYLSFVHLKALRFVRNRLCFPSYSDGVFWKTMDSNLVLCYQK